MNDGSYNFVSSAILQFIGWVSSLIYSLVSLVTQGFFNLSYIQIFKSDVVEEITARLYVVLAVFMIFKLAFSLIQYLVNPDQVNDKTAGMGKLVSRTATAFIMLIAVPIIFTEFIFGPPNAEPDHTYQAIIARAIPRIILANNVDADSDVGRSMGETMAATAFSAFVQPRETCEGAPSLTTATISDIADATYQRCSEAVEGGESSIFAYDYNWLLGLAVGLIMLVIMLFFTVDIAIRAIKLGILRIVAPIPIVTYIDPKSAKDGAFNNWLKALISTFLELFIKVAVIYIIIFIINELTSAQGGIFENTGLDTGEQIYATVFIIIGMLLFAVQASGFIKNIFGIKDAGGSAGLAALMGGAGALLAGGGLAGAALGMASGAQAGAQGKGGGQLGKGQELGRKMSGKPSFADRRAEKNRARFADKAGVGEDAIAAAEDRAQALQEQATEAEIQAKADPTNVEKQRLAAQMSAAAQKANDTVSKMKDYAKDPRKAAAQGKIYTRSQYARQMMKSGAAAAVASVTDRIPFHPSSAGNRIFAGIDQERNTMGTKMSGAEAMAASAQNTYNYQQYLNNEADTINDMNADAAYNYVHNQPTQNSLDNEPVGNYDVSTSQQAYSDDDWMDMMNEAVQNTIDNQQNNSHNSNNGNNNS